LLKVKNFKSSLGQKNILYWDFNQKEDLCRFLRTHIPARIEDLKRLSADSLTETGITLNDSLEVEIIAVEEEFGIIDYQELIEDSFATSSHSLNIIREATNWIGDELNKKTDEINKLMMQNHNQ